MIKSLSLNNFLPGFFAVKKTFRMQSAKKSESALNFYVSAGLIALNLMLLVSYIYGVNNYASKGYQIRTLQSQISDLNSSIKDLNLQVAKATSVINVENNFAATNFVPAGTPKFLRVSSQYSFNR